MKYPDGSTIQIGDLIWWNEGHCVGYVQVIVESREEYSSWGLGAPHIFVTNRHPFDPTLGSGVAQDEACLEEEGIRLLTPQERIELEQATVSARGLVAADLEFSFYSVVTDVKDGLFSGWVFTFCKDGKKLEQIEIPTKRESKA